MQTLIYAKYDKTTNEKNQRFKPHSYILLLNCRLLSYWQNESDRLSMSRRRYFPFFDLLFPYLSFSNIVPRDNDHFESLLVRTLSHHLQFWISTQSIQVFHYFYHLSISSFLGSSYLLSQKFNLSSPKSSILLFNISSTSSFPAMLRICILHYTTYTPQFHLLTSSSMVFSSSTLSLLFPTPPIPLILSPILLIFFL